MPEKKNPTIAIPAWHFNDLSGTGRVERCFLENAGLIPDCNFLVALPWGASESSKENSDFPNLSNLPRSKNLRWEFIPLNSSSGPDERTVERTVGRPLGRNSLSLKLWLESCYNFFLQEKVDLIFYFSPDVFLVKNSSDASWATSPAIPFISIIHDVMNLTLNEYRLNPFKYWSEKRKLLASKHAKKIITVSHFSKSQILRHLPLRKDQVEVVYNGVDNEVILETSKAKKDEKKSGRENTESPYLLYVGDFRKRKNVFNLIKAYAQLVPDLRKKYSLRLTGTGPLQEKMKTFLHKKDLLKKELINQVKFLGNVPFDQLLELYSEAALFVFPSLEEGFGLPVIEAQTHGVAVICGEHSSLKEIAGPNNEAVLYAKVTNVHDLKNKITLLLRDDALRKKIALKGRENAKRFTPEIMMREYRKILLGVLG